MGIECEACSSRCSGSCGVTSSSDVAGSDTACCYDRVDCPGTDGSDGGITGCYDCSGRTNIGCCGMTNCSTAGYDSSYSNGTGSCDRTSCSESHKVDKP